MRTSTDTQSFTLIATLAALSLCACSKSSNAQLEPSAPPAHDSSSTPSAPAPDSPVAPSLQTGPSTPTGSSQQLEPGSQTAASTQPESKLAQDHGREKKQKAHAGKPSEPWTQAKLEATSLEIQKDVEELRGAKFKANVPVLLSSKEKFVDYAMQRTETMEPKAKRSADETIQKMLGLIPPDMDLLAESLRLLQDQVGGFYDPSSKTFYLMENCPLGIAKIVLAHELGHAIDDQLYDIDGMLKKLSERTDMGAAYQAVVEGSGTSVMNRWTKEHISEIDIFAMTGMQDEQTAAMARAPMILWKPLLAAYLKGAAFLARTESVFSGQSTTATNADLDQAFRTPPKSTEQILHPAKYWEPAQRDEPLDVQQAPAGLPEGWSVLRRDVLGEMAIAVWTIAPAERERVDPKLIVNALSLDYTCPPAAGWGGDEIVLLGTGDAARALRWTTLWDSDRDAAEFFGAASMLVPALKATQAKLAGGKAKLAHADVHYGAPREVVIELGYGAKSGDFADVFEAFASK